ncbi:MAG: SRPBCC domain-containing protein [Chloroflexi bacterium]|nr:SRPBCC domain-containing protein [Chloroflexota bacterium]MQC26858.1 SRPBCC domain-containing protein [Chloroflexota bacterium]
MLAIHETEELKIQFEIEIAAAPAKVWAKLATLEGMNEWFARTLIFEHRVGGAFQMEGEVPEEGPYRFSGKVVKIVPEEELTFTWTSELGDKWPTHTLVSFRLEPSGGGTRVTLTHSGFKTLGAELANEEYEGHIEGWAQAKTLESLKEAVEAGS